MSQLISIVKTHPKKTIFFALAGGYVSNYFYKRFSDNRLRRRYCELVKQYGYQKMQPTDKLRNVMVLVNPAAKENDAFEKNILPLLYLAGLKVDIATGSRSAKIRDLAGVLDRKSTDAIVLVGGDGTAMEKSLKDIPIAIAPLGKVNNFVQRFLQPKENLVSWCYKVIEPLVENKIKNQDVMEIIPQDSDSDGNPAKHIYFLNTFEWSALREAEARRDRFWLTGPLRGYCACVWSTVKQEMTWRNKSAKLIYSLPCQGCNRCREPLPPPRKPSFFMSLMGQRPKKSDLDLIDYSTVENSQCGQEVELEVKDSAGIIVQLSEAGCLSVTVLSNYDNFRDYTSQCFRQINSTSCDKRESLAAPQITNLQCSSVKIFPEKVENEDFFIDNEKFEARPIQIKLRKDAIKLFSTAEKTTSSSDILITTPAFS